MRRGALLMFAAMLVGCGGNDGGDARLTKQEYASQADAICRKFEQNERSVGTPTEVAAIVTAVDRLLPNFDKAIDELGELRPPASKQATADEWLDSLQVLRADLVALRKQAEANDTAGIGDVARAAQGHNQRSNSLAAELGLVACSSG